VDKRQKFKKYYNETFSAIGIASFSLLILQMIGKGYFDIVCSDCGETLMTFEIAMLQVYIFIIITLTLYYYLYPLFIKNFLNRKKIAYTTMVIQIPIIFLLQNIIFNSFGVQKINTKYLLLIVTPVLFVSSAAMMIIVYFAEKTYYKRVNKKLNEFKQKEDEDNHRPPRHAKRDGVVFFYRIK